MQGFVSIDSFSLATVMCRFRLILANFLLKEKQSKAKQNRIYYATEIILSRKSNLKFSIT